MMCWFCHFRYSDSHGNARLITEAISHKRQNVLPVNRMVLESSKFPAAALLTKGCVPFKRMSTTILTSNFGAWPPLAEFFFDNLSPADWTSLKEVEKMLFKYNVFRHVAHLIQLVLLNMKLGFYWSIPFTFAGGRQTLHHLIGKTCHTCRHQWHIVFGLHLATLGISWGGGGVRCFLWSQSLRIPRWCRAVQMITSSASPVSSGLVSELVNWLILSGLLFHSFAISRTPGLSNLLYQPNWLLSAPSTNREVLLG